MVLCGVPRSGKTTFWKRLAIKDFKPTETSPSTGAAESHFISAHMRTEMLFDLHLYSEDKDLDREALTIYKLILEKHKNQSEITKPQTKSQEDQASETTSDTQKIKDDNDLEDNESSEPENDS